ncbi:fluoride efflux transporter CrcB [Lactobacillus sp.]|uniref:fluoride efflux transporter CrcB n=1 Tax=Lactobacillus sp. TaxID=1591 RepID=UPI0019C06C72|nr:fluoride efflux transporter CrcB [Lactobacillus sp.]MBD5430401.1 fluoride efflux transporter CrcB [Lactobacillus sp.]
MLATVITAGVGAIFGAIGRYFLTDYGKKHWSTGFPYATLVINLTGAFLLGIVFALNLSPFIYAFLGTGVLGGYTTFSTLNVELLNLWKNGKFTKFCIYLSASYFGGLALIFLGFAIGKVI